MKILLFGEYSGLFNCLKDGLIHLGHDVFLASDGDSYRNYPSDFNWNSKYKKKANVIFKYINVYTHLHLFTGFDVVLVMSSQINGKIPFLNDYILDFLIKNNGKVYLEGAGLDAYAFDFWNNKKESKYYYYTQGYIEGQKQKNNRKRFVLENNEKLKKSELRFMNKIEGYIPIMYEYAEPFRNFKQLKQTMPIPINTSKIIYIPNIPSRKIIFFHGLTRQCKGGSYILSAFEKLEKKYSNDAEFISKGGLPFKDYMELISKTNVILDDVNAYSLGMNGLFSMSQGKIVMGGAEEVANRELNYSSCPAINLERDVNQIMQSIEYIIENKNKIEKLGYESRKHVEKYHDHILIAQKYLDLWNKS